MIFKIPSMYVFLIMINILGHIYSGEISLGGKVGLFSFIILLSLVLVKKHKFITVITATLSCTYLLHINLQNNEIKNLEKINNTEFNGWVEVLDVNTVNDSKHEKYTSYSAVVVKTEKINKRLEKNKLKLILSQKIKGELDRVSFIRGTISEKDNSICYIHEFKNKNNLLDKELKHLIKGNTIISDKVKSFTLAFLFGDKSEMSADQIHIYQTSGTMHLFAVSGLHIGCLFVVITRIIRMVAVSQLKAQIVSLIILIGYLYLVNFSISATRAYIMLLIWVLSKGIGVKTNPINIVCLTAILIMTNQNIVVTKIAYLLTISVVITILWMNDKLLNNKNLKQNRFIKMNLINLAAYSGSFLILAKSFSLIVPVSILSNMVLIPCIFFIMPFAFVVLLILKFEILNWVIEIYNYIINLIILFCDFISKLKYSAISINEVDIYFYEKYLMYISMLIFSFGYFKKIKTKLLFLIINIYMLY